MGKKKPSIAEQIGSLWTDLAKNMPPPSFGAQLSQLGGLAPRTKEALHREMELQRAQSMAQMQQQQQAMNNLVGLSGTRKSPFVQQPFPVDLNFGGKQSIFQPPPPIGLQKLAWKGHVLEDEISEQQAKAWNLPIAKLRDLGYEQAVDRLSWVKRGRDRPESPFEWLDRRVDEIVRLVA